MKKINTAFSVAFIDLFAGAMGAIMLLFVIVPKKQANEIINPPDDASIIENKSLAQAVKLQKCLFVRIEWETREHDIDLHVETPDGTEYSFMLQEEAGKTLLSEDDLSGSGVEEFGFTENPPPGKYKVFYTLFEKNGNRENSKVKGLIIYKDGVIQLPTKTLTKNQERLHVADVTVTADGGVKVVSY